MTEVTTSTAAADVVQLDARIEPISFAVSMPDSVYTDWDKPASNKAGATTTTMLGFGDKGLVGTIVFLKKSVMVWFGWGLLQIESAEEEPTNVKTKSVQVGQATGLSMGPLIVAMPRTKYSGAFGDQEPSTSKLIGTESEDDEMIGRQMASRLSQRTGYSVLVSCSFAGAPEMAKQGVDPSSIQHRAAALAEREIGRLLQQHASSSGD